MTVLCIEELTEADLRILADHPRAASKAPSGVDTPRAAPRAAAPLLPARPLRAETAATRLPAALALAGGVS